ncbi:hypothetical protein N7470_007322 [Penicillium chermesinum]|nr:hypothetical protein N7470_007322 [Penicillium chermesinum]
MLDTPVLIIGAGISGLILAQHLQRHGVPFQIFDRDSAWTREADLVRRFSDTFVNKDAAARGDVGRFQFFNLKTGEALYSVPAAERIRVNRGRLRELLTSGLDVQSIDSAADSVTAHFDDGTAASGRLLVACDGARSRARQILYPDCQMNPLPVQLLGASPLYTAEEMRGAQSFDPFIFQGSHPDTDVFFFFSFLDTPSNFDESSRDRYHCQIIISWADSKGIPVPTGNAERVALMKKLTDNWAEPFRSLVHQIPADSEARSIRLEDWMLQRGRSHAHPRVVLVGDSAHTMTMSVAVGWMAWLIWYRSFTSGKLAASLAAYEKALFSRAEPSFLASRQACLDAHDFSKITEGSPLVAARVLK